MANDVRSRELLALAKKVALTNVTVFINGPTGTGKEVISNYIHNNSSRSEFPFVAVNWQLYPKICLRQYYLAMKRLLLLEHHKQIKGSLGQQMVEHYC